MRLCIKTTTELWQIAFHSGSMDYTHCPLAATSWGRLA